MLIGNIDRLGWLSGVSLYVVLIFLLSLYTYSVQHKSQKRASRVHEQHDRGRTSNARCRCSVVVLASRSGGRRRQPGSGNTTIGLPGFHILHSLCRRLASWPHVKCEPINARKELAVKKELRSKRLQLVDKYREGNPLFSLANRQCFPSPCMCISLSLQSSCRHIRGLPSSAR
jgi:hypothetical protein